MGHPSPERLGTHVDELDLVRPAHPRVRHRLALGHPGDRVDDIVDAFEMLDVDGGDDLDAGIEQPLDVLPALLVARAGHVRVRELIDEHDLGSPCKDGVDVQLRPCGAAVLDADRGDRLEIADLGDRLRTVVRDDQSDHDVGRALAAPPAFVEHRVRLADARCGAEVDAELPSGHVPLSLGARKSGIGAA